MKNNLFPGIIVKPYSAQKLARRLDLPKGAPIPPQFASMVSK